MAPIKVPCLLKIVLKCFKNVTPCCGELVTEAATRGVLEKKVFLKISLRHNFIQYILNSGSA